MIEIEVEYRTPQFRDLDVPRLSAVQNGRRLTIQPRDVVLSCTNGRVERAYVSGRSIIQSTGGIVNDWYLMRVDYTTDARTDEPEYQGSISGTIPATALSHGQQIVGVDWSRHGFVQVTFLIPGRGHERSSSEEPK